MPLYEYQCDACGHRFEAIQKFSDAPLDKCPKCGGALHKLQSAPAFHLKGSGWYATDYAKKDSSAEKAAEAKSEGSAKDGSSKEGSSKDGSSKDGAPKDASAGGTDAAAKSDKPATSPTPSSEPKPSTKKDA